MHRLFLLALILAVALLPLATVAAAPAAPLASPSAETGAPLLRHAKYVCGMVEGHFSCRTESGEAGPAGKGAIPKITGSPSSDQPPEALPGAPGTAAPAAGAADATVCGHGMVGTPPNNCRCPENSELLGGNCVHYTATCSKGMAAEVVPQPCAGPEEKLACKMRPDGLKDCCCITYDKF
jgi:hypothetical protein